MTNTCYFREHVLKLLIMRVFGWLAASLALGLLTGCGDRAAGPQATGLPIHEESLLPFEEPLHTAAAPYEPEIKVAHPRHTRETFGFQVIQESGQRPLLRIDTSAAATRHIYELYRKNALYKIIHVPGFRTCNRLIADRDRLFTTQETRRSVTLAAPVDWKGLPEYVDYKGPEVELKWGELSANPMSINYHLWQVEGQVKDTLALYVGERALPIHSFQLYIAGRGQLPELWVAESLQQPELQKRLWQLEPAQSLYFDRILVEPQPGCLALFPQAFAFNIEAEQPFHLSIAETGVPAPFFQAGKDTSRAAAYLSYPAIPLRQAIQELLETDTSQIHFRGLHHNPKLHITFASSRYTPAEGRAMILQQLQKHYRLDLERRYTTLHFEVGEANRPLLESHIRPDDPGRLVQDHQEKTALLLRVPFDEVLRLLEQELDVPIHNRTRLQGQELMRGRLDYSSIAAVRESLQQLGLQLKRSKSCLEVYVTQERPQ